MPLNQQAFTKNYVFEEGTLIIQNWGLLFLIVFDFHGNHFNPYQLHPMWCTCLKKTPLLPNLDNDKSVANFKKTTKPSQNYEHDTKPNL